MIVLLLVTIFGCRAIPTDAILERKDNPKPDIRELDYIDYVFPRSIDSLIAQKLQSLPDYICKNDIVLFYRLNDYFKLPSDENVHTTDYYIELTYIPDWKKESKFEYINSETLKYAAKRTNRFVGINNGHYLLPVVFGEDVYMMGRGFYEKPDTPFMYWVDILCFWVYDFQFIKIRSEGSMIDILKWRRSYIDKNGDIKNYINTIVE